MKKFKIPTKFKLLGNEITVKYTDDIYKNDDALGRAWFRKNLIELAPRKTIGCSEEYYTQVFFHELIHFILFYLRDEKIDHTDEDLTDKLSDMLTQVFTTMEY